MAVVENVKKSILDQLERQDAGIARHVGYCKTIYQHAGHDLGNLYLMVEKAEQNPLFDLVVRINDFDAMYMMQEGEEYNRLSAIKKGIEETIQCVDDEETRYHLKQSLASDEVLYSWLSIEHPELYVGVVLAGQAKPWKDFGFWAATNPVHEMLQRGYKSQVLNSVDTIANLFEEVDYPLAYNDAFMGVGHAGLNYRHLSNMRRAHMADFNGSPWVEGIILPRVMQYVVDDFVRDEVIKLKSLVESRFYAAYKRYGSFLPFEFIERNGVEILRLEFGGKYLNIILKV